MDDTMFFSSLSQRARLELLCAIEPVLARKQFILSCRLMTHEVDELKTLMAALSIEFEKCGDTPQNLSVFCKSVYNLVVENFLGRHVENVAIHYEVALNSYTVKVKDVASPSTLGFFLRRCEEIKKVLRETLHDIASM